MAFLASPFARLAPQAIACGLALLVAAWPAGAAPPSALRSVEANQKGDTWVVDLVMFAPVPQTLAYQVLTDFDHMSQFAPNVRESKVLKTEGNKVTIQQTIVRGFPSVSRRLIETDPAHGSIHSTQIEGTLKRVESQLDLKTEGDGTLITYHLEIVPSALAAAVISKRKLESDIAEQFGAMIDEMVKRRN